MLIFLKFKKVPRIIIKGIDTSIGSEKARIFIRVAPLSKFANGNLMSAIYRVEACNACFFRNDLSSANKLQQVLNE
jgi:hypothetical protein